MATRTVPQATKSDLARRRENGRRRNVAPDAFIVLGVSLEDMGEDRSYFVELMGEKPHLVMEIASPSAYEEDLGDKRELYAFLEIPEYWLVDPSGGQYYGSPLIGLRLVDGEYVEIEMTELPDGSIRGRSDVLGTYLYWVNGELRLRDPASGRWLRTPMELVGDVEAAEARAQAAETEAANLREQLRKLRQRG